MSTNFQFTPITYLNILILWTRTEVTAAARLAGGFTEAACYGDFSGGVSPSAPEAWRMIIVLRRL
jgi:hypothetical protein